MSRARYVRRDTEAYENSPIVRLALITFNFKSIGVVRRRLERKKQTRIRHKHRGGKLVR